MAKQAQQTQPSIKPPEKTADQVFWEAAARKGFFNFQIVAKAEDLGNPNTDYVSFGFKDANGLPIPVITGTKEMWVTHAKLVLAKYGKE